MGDAPTRDEKSKTPINNPPVYHPFTNYELKRQVKGS